ncbi:MAG TPA: cupin domain-containing protein [Acetobacteraceae bacterium]
MANKSEQTRAVDARTNRAVEPLQFEVNSHDDYLRLRETLSAMPKTPLLTHVDDAPVTRAPMRTYNWFLTSEQSGGSIVIHVLTLEPGFAAEEHHHPAEEEFFFILDGQLEMTIGNRTEIVGPGTFAYAPPHCTHAFRPHGDKPCKVLHWNSPGGHERMAAAQQRLTREGHTGGADRRKAMEDHDYVFHDTSRFADAPGR